MEMNHFEEIAIDKLLNNRFLKMIIGDSVEIKILKEKITHVSAFDVNVLISGESGTGKELVARAIHYLSKRAPMPFVPVNCGSIPENLFENELFGHCKGAYTDASVYQKGLVKESEGGTLFLDEVNTIAPYVQVKLLRFLQDGTYKVLGDSKRQKSDVRIISATNENLQKLIENKTFREDLFYRINVVNLQIPPLRDRKKDIPLLIDHFWEKYSLEYQRNIHLTDVLKDKLVSHSWPGNVRELENKIQQLVVMWPSIGESLFDDTESSDDQTNVQHISTESFDDAKAKVICEFEKNYLVKLMRTYRGDVVGAARKIGKGRTALWNLLSKHNLSPKNFT